jgi:hypothetical protein
MQKGEMAGALKQKCQDTPSADLIVAVGLGSHDPDQRAGV